MNLELKGGPIVERCVVGVAKLNGKEHQLHDIHHLLSCK